VIVAEPAETPVTEVVSAPVVTVATEGLLLIQVPPVAPPPSVNVMGAAPTQTAVGPEMVPGALQATMI
jgi:hypothetical protein